MKEIKGKLAQLKNINIKVTIIYKPTVIREKLKEIF